MINSHHLPYSLENIGESFEGPKLPWRARDMQPLIDATNEDRIRIIVCDPRSKDKVKTFDKPRAINPYIIFIRNRCKSKKHTPIPQCNIFNLALDMLPI